MLFNSYVFVLLFFPIVLIGYFSLNHFNKYNLSKIFLLIASLFFYGYFNWWYLLIIISSIILNYFFSSCMLKTPKEKSTIRKTVFAVSLTINIGSLFFFKYYDFFISNINGIFNTNASLLNLMLPLGISFFTFQQLSYVIDSYKYEVPVYSFLDYALFVTYFPQLIAGPIVTHDEMVPQFADLKKKKFSSDNFAKGLYGFAIGLAKKVIIADSFGLVVDSAFADVSNLGTLNALFVMFAYTFQIYFDFSGYCDMATGIGKMMNIDITMNFNSPYKAINIVDFWKRWHITLTRFFTRYIYIPLGGNRKGNIRTYFNILIVFLVSGIWHGANWTFILWGILHGIANVFTRLIDKNTTLFSKDKPFAVKFIFWLITFIFINFTWVIFRADSVSQAFEFYKQIFSFNLTPINKDFIDSLRSDGLSLVCYFIPIIGDYIIRFAPALLMVFSLYSSTRMKNINERIEYFKPDIIKSVITAALLVWCVMSFAGVSSFLYWNF